MQRAAGPQYTVSPVFLSNLKMYGKLMSEGAQTFFLFHTRFLEAQPLNLLSASALIIQSLTFYSPMTNIKILFKPLPAPPHRSCLHPQPSVHQFAIKGLTLNDGLTYDFFRFMMLQR